MKSSTAAPSFRNSGFEATSKSILVIFLISSRTISVVPTGTVLFVTITLYESRLFPMDLATSTTALVSAEPSSLGGVPTAIKTINEFFIA